MKEVRLTQICCCKGKSIVIENCGYSLVRLTPSLNRRHFLRGQLHHAIWNLHQRNFCLLLHQNLLTCSEFFTHVCLILWHHSLVIWNILVYSVMQILPNGDTFNINRLSQCHQKGLKCRLAIGNLIHFLVNICQTSKSERP